MNKKIKMETEINLLVNTFFEKLELNIESIEVIKEEENIFLIKIKTPDSWIIIWPQGKNLESIKLILKLLISKKIWNKIKLHMEVNDYMESKDEKLFSFINSKISIVEKTSKDIQLPFYSAYERKKIHSFVADYWNANIYTKSIWEWKERRLYICKKDVKLTIDIDWDDI